MKKLLAALLCALMLICPAMGASAEKITINSNADQIMEIFGVRFGVTEDMGLIHYQTDLTLAQMNFVMDGVSYAARIQPTAGFENISEFQLESWDITDEFLNGWCEATAMMAKVDEDILALCLWYDAAPGVMYSVSARVQDFKGLDIQHAAEAVYLPMQDDADGLDDQELLNVLIECTGYAGSAGSSLKNAIAACKLAAFAAEKKMADMDEQALAGIAAKALAGLTDVQKKEIAFNSESMDEVLTAVFTDYEKIRWFLEDAGVAADMEVLVSADRVFEHYEALHEALKAAGL